MAPAPALSRWQDISSSGVAGLRVFRPVNLSAGDAAYGAICRQPGNPVARGVTRRFTISANGGS